MKNAIFMLATNLGAVLVSLLGTVIAQEYDLVVIEEMDTPLAGGPVHTNYYVLTLCAIAVMLLIALFVAWFLKRTKLVKRLQKLNAQLNKTEKAPLFIKAIKEEILRAESEITASMI